MFAVWGAGMGNMGVSTWASRMSSIGSRTGSQMCKSIVAARVGEVAGSRVWA